MKFSIAAIVGALAATVLAKPAFTNLEFNIQEGTPFTLNWVNATGPVTIVLIEGATAGTMVPVKTLATGVSGTSYVFTPSDLPSGRYAFRINDAESASDPNFSAAFQYVGTAVSSSRSATITSSATTTSAPTTSATTVETETSTRRTSSHATTATTTPRPTQSLTNNNNAQRFSSPLALVIITAAALIFFN